MNVSSNVTGNYLSQKPNFFTNFLKSFRSTFSLKSLQRLGKSLMYPIALLPMAALLNRVGALGLQYSSAGSWAYDFWKVFQAPGATVFNNLGIIFAVGVAFGLSKDHRGEAALVGLLGYLILALLTSESFIASWLYDHVFVYNATSAKARFGPNYNHSIIGKSQLLYTLSNNVTTYILDTGVFGGITIGIFTSLIYNKWKDIKLPQALGFFGGRRFIPMIAMLISWPIGLSFAIMWPWFQFGLTFVGDWIAQGAIATGSHASYGFKIAMCAGFYGVVNRFLQPFGLHHIINTFLWFQLPIDGKEVFTHGVWYNGTFYPQGSDITVNGDIAAYNQGVYGSGIFETGFFPLFLGGLPAAGCAMIMTTKKSNRKKMIAFLGGVALVAFLTGIDEPLAFAFIFVSPLLWVIHAIFTGIICAVTAGMGIRLSFGFSAGFIDFVISLLSPLAWPGQVKDALGPDSAFWGAGATLRGILANPMWIIPLSMGAFAMYYFTFKFLILKLNIPTPGRNEDSNDFSYLNDSSVVFSKSKSKDDKYMYMAQEILVAIGGKSNVTVSESCATRLRLVVKDNSKTKINDQKILGCGVYQIKRLGKNGLQLIIGTDVEHVSNALDKLLK